MAQQLGDHIYGPIDGSVLTGQTNHRSGQVGEDTDLVLRARRADNLYFKDAYTKTPHHRVLLKLQHMGLYRVYKLGLFKNDMGLITALVERWRPETNTFHLRTGEATITLQDITLIFGLPVDGRPLVTNRVFVGYVECAAYIFEQLGFQFSRSDFEKKGFQIKLAKIVSYVISDAAQITAESDEMQVDQIARCWALMLLGVLCPNTTGDVVPVLWLTLFEDINATNTYSWGSGVLAWLYRALNKASQKGQKNIDGSMPLLQIWAWSRILVVRPSKVPGPMAGLDEHDIARAPYGARWYHPIRNDIVVPHSLRTVRDGLDQMGEGHFVWTPYHFIDKDIDELPPQCLDSVVWRASVPMIFFDVVEHHRPERVFRQFGLKQYIPPHVDYVRRKDRRGRNVNWENVNGAYIAIWNDRGNKIVTGQSIQGRDDKEQGYNEWYDLITRRYISPVLTRRTMGHQTGSAPLLQNVYNRIQEVQNIIEQVPQTRHGVEKVLGQVRSSLTSLENLVTCGHSDDVATGAHTHRHRGESILPQRRRRSALLEDSEDTEVDEDEDVEDDEDEDVIPRMSEAPTSQYVSPHIDGSSFSTFVRPYIDGPSSSAYARPYRGRPSSSTFIPYYRGRSSFSALGPGYRGGSSSSAFVPHYRGGSSSAFVPHYRRRPSS